MGQKVLAIGQWIINPLTRLPLPWAKNVYMLVCVLVYGVTHKKAQMTTWQPTFKNFKMTKMKSSLI